MSTCSAPHAVSTSNSTRRLDARPGSRGAVPAFTKSLMGVKSVKEAIDLQAGFTKSSIEKAVSETNKLTDASVKLAEQTIAPITARITLAVETFSKTR